MSDFLFSLDKRFSPGNLVNLAQMPYPYRRPEGEAFEFPWGNLAVLQERFGRNVFRINGAVIAWVGDLVTEVFAHDSGDNCLYRRRCLREIFSPPSWARQPNGKEGELNTTGEASTIRKSLPS